MPINAIQFQYGLSLPEFRYFLTRNGLGRQLWECFVCGYQSSSYLAEFCYRFNRRFLLPSMLARLLRALTTTRVLPLKVLRVSEACL